MTFGGRTFCVRVEIKSCSLASQEGRCSNACLVAKHLRVLHPVFAMIAMQESIFCQRTMRFRRILPVKLPQQCEQRWKIIHGTRMNADERFVVDLGTLAFVVPLIAIHLHA